MIQVIRVSGSSLAPIYQEGDFVVIVKIPFLLHINRLKEDDVIVFQLPDYGVMMKRVQYISSQDGGIFVYGTHPSSIDSRHFGPIRQIDIIGKVIWHIPGQRTAQ
jgi:signal peptidase I